MTQIEILKFLLKSYEEMSVRTGGLASYSGGAAAASVFSWFASTPNVTELSTTITLIEAGKTDRPSLMNETQRLVEIINRADKTSRRYGLFNLGLLVLESYSVNNAQSAESFIRKVEILKLEIDRNEQSSKTPDPAYAMAIAAATVDIKMLVKRFLSSSTLKGLQADISKNEGARNTDAGADASQLQIIAEMRARKTACEAELNNARDEHQRVETALREQLLANKEQQKQLASSLNVQEGGTPQAGQSDESLRQKHQELLGLQQREKALEVRLQDAASQYQQQRQRLAQVEREKEDLQKELREQIAVYTRNMQERTHTEAAFERQKQELAAQIQRADELNQSMSSMEIAAQMLQADNLALLKQVEAANAHIQFTAKEIKQITEEPETYRDIKEAVRLFFEVQIAFREYVTYIIKEKRQASLPTAMEYFHIYNWLMSVYGMLFNTTQQAKFLASWGNWIEKSGLIAIATEYENGALKNLEGAMEKAKGFQEIHAAAPGTEAQRRATEAYQAVLKAKNAEVSLTIRLDRAISQATCFINDGRRNTEKLHGVIKHMGAFMLRNRHHLEADARKELQFGENFPNEMMAALESLKQFAGEFFSPSRPLSPPRQ